MHDNQSFVTEASRRKVITLFIVAFSNWATGCRASDHFKEEKAKHHTYWKDSWFRDIGNIYVLLYYTTLGTGNKLNLGCLQYQNLPGKWMVFFYSLEISKKEGREVLDYAWNPIYGNRSGKKQGIMLFIGSFFSNGEVI